MHIHISAVSNPSQAYLGIGKQFHTTLRFREKLQNKAVENFNEFYKLI
jgi:hypothetical protein